MKRLHVAANGGDLAEDCGGDTDEAIFMDREIWLEDNGGDHGHGDDLIVHDHDPSIFYGDLPAIPSFPCMSSSSSSSTSPAHVNAIISSASSSSTAASSSTSSAASWAILRSDGEDPPQNQNSDVDTSAALKSNASMEIPLENSQGFGCGEGSDMMETFGYMDLLDSNEFFLDTAAIFSQEDDNTPNPNLMDQTLNKGQDQVVVPVMESGGDMQNDDDLASVFLEWLKNNKESVSAEDLRKVKIKKSTIESAATRLGGGKEAMKQLLKLILEWVQTNHLHRRHTTTNNNQEDPFQSPNPTNNNLIPPPSDQTCFLPSTWVSDPGFGYIPAPTYPPQEYLPLPESGPMPHQQFTMPNSQFSPFQEPGGGFTGYNMNNPYQYPYGQMRDQRLLRVCSSATKEARKKRMARQRRLFSHHHRHSNNNNNPSHAQLGESCATVAAPQLKPVTTTTVTGETWMYWTNVPAVPPPGSAQLPTIDQTGSTSAMSRQQVVPDRPQGWKQEKNLRFLLQKVLKQSDVGNLGRIVLPKKEAETHLPELEARDGIPLTMEDIGTSRVWNMRYRFWPNNKSRMYLLENTGDFVKTNGLQEGDFIVIYSDVKCGKYLIRGVKVRQPAGQKPEAPPSSAVPKKQGKSKRSIKNNSPSANMVASPTSLAVK